MLLLSGAYLVSGASFGSLAYASAAFALVTMTGGEQVGRDDLDAVVVRLGVVDLGVVAGLQRLDHLDGLA